MQIAVNGGATYRSQIYFESLFIWYKSTLKPFQKSKY